MKKLFPHHSVISKGFDIKKGKLTLLPEMWLDIDSNDLININELLNFGVIKTTDADVFQVCSEFIITDSYFFQWLENTNFFSYTIFCEEEYLNELPVFYGNEWSNDINTTSMSLLGWTVNKFSEPACFFGSFPIEIDVDDDENILEIQFINEDMLNEYGLIREYQCALKVAEENTQRDDYGEFWRPLALYVDSGTLKRINFFLDSLN